MNTRFIDYLRSDFQLEEEEILQIQDSLTKPLKKSLRINTARISIQDFIVHVNKLGWTLTPTDIAEVFYVDREDITCPLGSTPEHLFGYIYIQEVAAGSSVNNLREIHDENAGSILDMCASPGGKTTQISEYYPNSLIVANEIDKTRLPQLFTNLDRLGHTNIIVTNMDGRQYRHVRQMFDAIVLDAPCSGEGTGFKWTNALKNWHIKNIRRIAKLQTQLFLSAFKSLKVWAHLVYSTCTLNKLENEWVIEKSLKKIEDHTEIKETKRFWPHKTGTGGFFISGFRKITEPELDDAPIWEKIIKNNIQPADKRQIAIVERFFVEHFPDYTLDGVLYSFQDEIYLSSRNIKHLTNSLYCMKVGLTIGKIQEAILEPTHQVGFLVRNVNIPSHVLTKEQEEMFLYGREIPITEELPRYIQIYSSGNLLLGLAKVEEKTIYPLVEKKLLRK